MNGTVCLCQSILTHPSILIPATVSIPFSATRLLSILCYPSPFHSRVPDGELIERIIADNALTEAVAVRYLSQLLGALECLHLLSVAHLDIKVQYKCLNPLLTHKLSVAT